LLKRPIAKSKDGVDAELAVTRIRNNESFVMTFRINGV